MDERFSYSSSTSTSSTSINSSNIGFQLLKKHGWKEGTGLGICEQGRLEPLQVHMKKNKHGLGAVADKEKTFTPKPPITKAIDKPSKKAKVLSKKMRKIQDLENRRKEKEFERAFFMEFWPENV